MSTISSGTTLTTALVQTGDTTGDLVIKTGASNTTAMTISGTDQSVVISGTLTSNINASSITSGVLAVARGGTGLSSPGTTGNVLTSNGTAWTSAVVPPGVPTGSVIYVAQNTAPTGYLKANGAAVSRTTYADLFTAIGTTFGAGDGSTTFLVPDIRGEFMRGWDDGRGIDSGRAFGSAQTDAMQGHRHGYTLSPNFGAVNGLETGGNNAGSIKNEQGITSPISDGTNGTPRTASETRPRNIALLACIKF
jgi:phage-related tail fiber protein